MLDFETFWKAYPKKRSKGAALKAWNKLKPNEEFTSRILKSVEEHKKTQDWIKQGGQFIPYPATFLNQGCYDDEIESQVLEILTIK